MRATRYLKAKEKNPITFKTCNKDVYENMLSHGSLWIRSVTYYQNDENTSRQDENEGIHTTTHTFPMRVERPNNAKIFYDYCTFQCRSTPHYIFCFHGVAISDIEREKFGGYTLGIRSPKELCGAIAEQLSKKVKVTHAGFSAVSYRWAQYGLSNSEIIVDGNDYFRKDPILPYINQDEWRMVFPVESYKNEDPNEIIKINVDPDHFYRYIE